MWEITKIVKKGEYLYGVCKQHPKATQYGYVLEHRLVMENHLGRMLSANEIVHHINGNKHDNRIENLEVMDGKEHSRMHSSTGRTYLEFICPNCGITFKKEKRQLHGQAQPKCSRKCNGQYSRKIQMGLV